MNFGIGSYILNAKSDINTQRTSDYAIPLHLWAAHTSDYDKNFPEIEKKFILLILAGSDVTIRNAQEKTALDLLLTGIRDSLAIGLRENARGASLIATQLKALTPPDPECSICLQNIKMTRVSETLSCLHSFHKNCIDQWLAEHNNCPMCRTEVPGRHVAQASTRSSHLAPLTQPPYPSFLSSNSTSNYLSTDMF